MIITSKTPRLNLHDEIVDIAKVLVEEFISDNYKLKNSVIIIIHGKSTNIMTKAVHQILMQNSKVKSYKLNNWNLGETIIELNIE
ncbi:MAG: hypothetical protein E7172_01960 [Firmicutes bacterium]|nr:hypothetical protein [Bacillota bacterium]